MNVDLFGSLAMDIDDSEGNFCVVGHGLDKQEGILRSLNAHKHSWEQPPGKEMEFGKGDVDLGKWEMDIGNLGVDFEIVEIGRFDKWR